MLSPPITLFPTNIAVMGRFKVSIVGCLTSTQFIATIKNYLVHNVVGIDILDFYNITTRVANMWKLQLL
jgi:hypothetical protein